MSPRRAVGILAALLMGLLGVALAVEDRLGRPVLTGWVSDLSDEQGFVRVLERWPAIQEAAAREGLDPTLVGGVMWCESRGVSGRTSNAGALGLMQLMMPSARDAARRLELPEPTREQVLEDDDLNLRLGCEHLAWLVRSSPTWGAGPVLVAYNTGRGRTQRWIDEAGSFEAWDEAQRARHQAGERPSPAWSYAQRVLGAREELASRLGLLGVD